MKQSHTCPKCQHHKFLVVQPFQIPDPEYSNTVFPMRVATEKADDGTSRVSQGRFEAWVCAACGLTEWYARDLEDLLRGNATMPGNARIVDAEAKGGPFR